MLVVVIAAVTATAVVVAAVVVVAPAFVAFFAAFFSAASLAAAAALPVPLVLVCVASHVSPGGVAGGVTLRIAVRASHLPRNPPKQQIKSIQN